MDKLDEGIDLLHQLVGTPFGWINNENDIYKRIEEPLYNKNAPIPSINYIKRHTCICSGIPNLLLRFLNLPIPFNQITRTSGTIHDYFSCYTIEPFMTGKKYAKGTLIGRKYRDSKDPGHLAIVGNNEHLIQSTIIGNDIKCVTDIVPLSMITSAFYDFIIQPHIWLRQTPHRITLNINLDQKITDNSNLLSIFATDWVDEEIYEITVPFSWKVTQAGLSYDLHNADNHIQIKYEPNGYLIQQLQTEDDEEEDDEEDEEDVKKMIEEDDEEDDDDDDDDDDEEDEEDVKKKMKKM